MFEPIKPNWLQWHSFVIFLYFNVHSIGDTWLESKETKEALVGEARNFVDRKYIEGTRSRGGVISEEWSYSDPGGWPGFCGTGKRQSPIDISTKNITIAKMPPIEYVNYDRNFLTFIENEGFTIALMFDDENHMESPSIRGSVIQDDYTLSNIHFHWKAEHTINQKRYPLEVHFVHYKTSAGSLNNALNFEDGIVVLAVFYQISEISNGVFDVITRTVDAVAHRVGAPVELDDKISPQALLPQNLHDFFTYQGSLTTPNCNEVVTWIVYPEPVNIHRSQFDKLTAIYTAKGEPVQQNYRPLQALHGREVLQGGTTRPSNVLKQITIKIVVDISKGLLRNQPLFQLFEQLTNIYTENDERVLRNYRKQQPLNGRKVRYTKGK